MQAISLRDLEKPDIPPSQTASDRLQLDFVKGDHARMHKHLGRDECALIISGGGTLYYESNGERLCSPLGAYGGTNPFYCRVFGGTVHSLRLNGIAQQSSPGPFSRDHTIFDTEYEAVRASCYSPLPMIRTGAESFHTSEPVVLVGNYEIERLKHELPNTERKRIRLCTHKNSNELLHEMFVLYTRETWIQPNKHLVKDETFHILEGTADFIFYSDSGDVTDIIPLGSKDSGKRFFVRVDQGRYHTVVMTSDYLVIQESTPGPYDRAHTVWAPWWTHA